MTDRRKAREPGERWACECGQELIGAMTINGKVAPITLDPKDNGNVWLGRAASRWWLHGHGEVDPGQGALPIATVEPALPDRTPARMVICAVLGGPLLEKAREHGMGLHLNHFADCPARGRYQR